MDRPPSHLMSPAAIAALLKACAEEKNLYKGILIHGDILKKGLYQNNNFIGNSLINLYAKCGEFGSAHHVFRDLPSKDVISWNALVTGYVQHGQSEKAIDCLDRMQKEGFTPDAVTLAVILKACGSLGALKRGKDIHDVITAKGFLHRDTVLGNALVDMYAKCCALVKAEKVFNELPNRNVNSWNALIGGYCHHGLGEEALKCFQRMKHASFSPNAITFTSIVNACGLVGAAEKCEEVYAEIVERNLLENNVVLGNAVLDMYTKIGCLTKAQQVFDNLPVKNVITWTTLIKGYCEHDCGAQAISCFECMKHDGCTPDGVTYSCIFKACSTTRALPMGQEVHSETARKDLTKDVIVGNALVDMYAKCGALSHSKEVFDDLDVRDVVSWNALLAGYCQYERGKEALGCYQRMICEGISADVITWTCMLKASGLIDALDKGIEIHAKVITQGSLGSVRLGNSLIDMYSKCGLSFEAQRVFNSLPTHDAVSWNSLLAGYCENELSKEALECLGAMKSKGFTPDDVTLSCILRICRSTGATEKGREVHAEIVKLGWPSRKRMVLGNVLVDMYAKCSLLAKAQQVFEELLMRDTISWNSLIGGFCQHGCVREAFCCYEQMQSDGVSPDAGSFASVLKSCSMMGAADKGLMYIESISLRYGSALNLEHFTCMVDLLARSGHLDKAIILIKKMPWLDYLPAWSALLSACQKLANIKLGKWAFENAVQLDPQSPVDYFPVSDIFHAACMGDGKSLII